MKVRQQAAVAALAVAASAQTTSPPVSYTTVTYDQCETQDIQTMITVTNGVTVTYCPECHHDTPTTSKKPGHTTIYTTEYLSLCETGLVPVTHTITESCEDEKPTWTPGPSHIPHGFTVTVKECTVCDKTPVPVTITEPCDCEATSGTPVAPKPTGTPIGQIPDGQIQNPAPGGDGGHGPKPTGAEPTGNVPSAPGSGHEGTAPPYPTGGATTVRCPGPECLATGGHAMPSDVVPIKPGDEGGDKPSNPEPTGPAPYEGSASLYSQFGFVTSIALSVVIGGLAFAL